MPIQIIFVRFFTNKNKYYVVSLQNNSIYE